MKRGVRALGVAESFREDWSTLAGVVTRASSVVDGFAFTTCTVGGTDATDAICALFDDLGRDDVQYVLVAGIAPAWFNVVDLHRVADHTDRPVLSVTYEESNGLESALREQFDGDALDRRLATYRDQPDRQRVCVADDTVFVRAVGLDDDAAAAVVDGFTPEGGRPEPLRVARLAARGADDFRRDGSA
ncbi:endonuclease dU [Halorientalis regularis]|uniref:UPF0215 protein SAMN05216218_106172 n=1 Tax=Halorientalis regularis TaxID=660518 RepID=A0A1G7L5N4_9EURY|nr:DUF99 family protein [Halorientalis regularis]SDF44763.1 hypothetical protein SAMN05216218_106172 [Halorientalis regularis]